MIRNSDPTKLSRRSQSDPRIHPNRGHLWWTHVSTIAVADIVTTRQLHSEADILYRHHPLFVHRDINLSFELFVVELQIILARSVWCWVCVFRSLPVCFPFIQAINYCRIHLATINASLCKNAICWQTHYHGFATGYQWQPHHSPTVLIQITQLSITKAGMLSSSRFNGLSAISTWPRMRFISDNKQMQVFKCTDEVKNSEAQRLGRICGFGFIAVPT